MPAEGAERGIYYAAFDLEGCIIEIFGDTKVIDYGEKHVASPIVTREQSTVHTSVANKQQPRNT
jgi:hypothetical protein